MIVQLSGTLSALTSSTAILDVGGVGFELGISATTAAALPPVGTPATTLLARMSVREDAISLFGFASAEERSLFDKLCTVSGVGPKLALAVLSTFTPAQLAAVVVAEDASQMSRVPGVGKKLAGRLLLELEGVFAKDPILAGLAGSASLAAQSDVAGSAASGVEADVLAALLAMGFTTQEASLALQGADEAGAYSEKAALAYALRRLGRHS